MTSEPGTRDIVVEELLPHPPEKVWRALTTAAIIGQWLMPTDFEPIVGKRFTLTTRPMGSWDGVIRCEVLEIVPLSRRVYSWVGGSDDENGKDNYASRLDSVVTWTLAAQGTGTRLRLVHSGFRSPHNDFAYGAMSPGWQKIVRRLGEVAASR